MALSLLFVFGSICLVVSYVLELNLSLPALLKLMRANVKVLVGEPSHNRLPLEHQEVCTCNVCLEVVC